jgi:hypothetical protein
VTGDDELRRRLRDVDPARPGGPTSSQPGPTAHDILERAMRTAEQHPTSTTTPGPEYPAGLLPGGRGRPLLVAGLAAAAVAVVGGGLALSGVLGSADGTPSPAPTLALTAAPGDAASSCAVFDVGILAAMPTALSGTVTAVDGTTVTVEVDRWYRGGPADVVTVSSDQRGAALDGVELVAGEDYLITAGEDGVVSSCGYSGAATPELRSAFDQAFGG